MTVWLIPSLITLVLWGFWGFLPKIATQHIDPRSALIYQAAGAVAISLAVAASMGFRLQTAPKGILFSILTGIAGNIGFMLFLSAINRGNASAVIAVTSLYPAVVILLAVVFLREAVTVRQVIGMALACGAIVLLSG